jgi:hypothetical protein
VISACGEGDAAMRDSWVVWHGEGFGEREPTPQGAHRAATGRPRVAHFGAK